ncbi:hypothetical protein E4Z66_17190 [Aliishimia ponticola]|uniref:LPS export ABC transporter periplasmic protein LptC n=1 Tax=Aliishimia ponticola TaxID=2499833 RepID=A0A4S4N828_9RHOB|nr:LPS export ABC transporter periplasmic protein LptC [Aliishimia ponticola]THH34705.1 hypothetical protein E4Z66_17190 [Aliishimia ponticola]
MAADRYTRMVTFFKVALPLIALAILSTLFLLSSRIRPGDNIPFAETEIDERIRGQQVTGPFFSGVTSRGDRISFSATNVVTGEDRSQEAHDLNAQLDFSTGGSVTLEATRGKIELGNDMATLLGDILIDSTTGFRMVTNTVITSLTGIDVTAPGEVRATGPAGTLTAGQMRITSNETNGNVEILFSGGVMLVYEPGKQEK